MRKKRPFQRTERVSQQIQEILAGLLLTSVSDPRLRNLQITYVEVTPDLRRANIQYVAISEDADLDAMADGLLAATGYLRRQLGARMETKFTPELVFELDETMSKARRIEELLGGLSSREEGTDGAD